MPFLVLIALFALVSSFALADDERLFGVNLAGAEFFAGQDGPNSLFAFYDHEITFFWPNQLEVDYFKSKGMNSVRLPFRWERLQRELNSPFDPEELGRMQTFVAETTAKGITVILDPHNYARYHGGLIGSNAVPHSAFADFWGRLAALFKDNPKVIFNLMNEPSRMRTDQWRIAANAAIAAIRDTGATNLIFVPGNGWTGAHSWLQNWYAQESPNSGVTGPNGYRVGSNAEEMLNIVDPLDRVIFEMHQYFDHDFAGKQPDCQSETIGSEKLAAATQWLRTHGKKGFIGEFGAGDNAACLAALRDITQYMADRPDAWLGWSYWAAGRAWGDYFTSLEPENLESDDPIDRPQLAALVIPVVISEDAIAALNYDAGSHTLSFLGKVGHLYQLQKSATLDPEDWTDLGSPITGNDQTIEVQLPREPANVTKHFYRAVISR